jgi:[ribosomal protein S5]-alanine N-acetyltransferase
MRPPVTFDTPRLHLRPPVIEDAEGLFAAYMQDTEVTKYLTWRPHQSAEETRGFVQHCIARWPDGPSFPWVIVKREDGELLGMLEMRINEFKAEIGYVLARRFWVQGYMTEAVRALLDWAIAQPEIYRVWATCDVENIASARVLEKAGMQREGLLRRWIVHPNIGPEPRDSWCYARVR